MFITGFCPGPEESGHVFTILSSEIHFNVKIRKSQTEKLKKCKLNEILLRRPNQERRAT